MQLIVLLAAISMVILYISGEVLMGGTKSSVDMSQIIIIVNDRQ